MTNQHPLTEEIMGKIHGDEPGYSNPYDEDDMRGAADWQLDQDWKKLELFLQELTWHLSWEDQAGARRSINACIENFKSSMRPQQQEDNS